MSHISEFYKSPTHDYSSFFDEATTSTDVSDSYKKVAALRKQLEEAQAEYTARINCDLKSTITPINKPVILHYAGRTTNLYFDALTGTALSPDGFDTETSVIIRIDGRSGEVIVPIGYCYSLGAFVSRMFNYTIPTNNAKINLKMNMEYLIPLIENKDYTVYTQASSGEKGKFTTSSYMMKEYISHDLNCSQFVEEMFGIPNTDNRFCNLSLSSFANCTSKNKSYQTLLEIEDTEAMYTMLKMEFKEVAPPYKHLGIKKETFDALCKERRLLAFIKLMENLRTASADDQIRYNEAFSKTSEEWAEFVIKAKQWSETLDFYNIRCSEGDVAIDLIKAYSRVGWTYRGKVKFHEYYKFGKFCKYVIEETVEQGFNRIENFINTLSDYIEVCEKYATVPTLYSRELQKVHDVVVRNHSITFSADQIASFNDKYVGYKEPVIDNYQVIYPKSPNDMVKEGDSLNHCCAFYVKKVLDNECKVLFLRLKDKIEESLITFEIKGTAITQAEGFLHRDPNETEMKVLEKYAKDNALIMAL